MPLKDGVRCSGCGKVLLEGDELVEIRIGRIEAGVRQRRFAVSGVWGLVHKSPCFARMTSAPGEVMAELRKLSQRSG